MFKLRPSHYLLACFILLALALTPPSAKAQGPLDTVNSFFNQAKNKAQRVFLRVIPGAKSGKAVLQQSLAASENMTSVYYVAKIDAETFQQEQSQGKFNVTLDGPAEVQNVYDPSNYKQQLHMTGQMSMDGTTLSADADTIIVNEQFYVKINQLPALFFSNLDEIKGQWLKFDTTGQLPEETQPEQQQLTAEQMTELRQAAKDLVEQVEVSQAQKEKKEGQRVFVLSMTVPDEALISYVKRVEEITQTSESTLTPEQQEQEAVALEKSIAQLDPLVINLWIDQATFYIRHLDTNLAYRPDAQAAMSLTGPANELDLIRVYVSFDFDKFNQPIDVVIPTDTRDGQEVMMKAMGGLGQFGALGTTPASISEEKMNSLPLLKGGDEDAVTNIPELPTLTPEQRELLEQYGY